MKRQHRVLWSKGLFLSSQHFQAQDSYFEEELRFRNAVARYANWGVSDLEIDKDSVEAGEFRIIRCAGIMPDGLAFSFGGAEPAPQTESFADSSLKVDELNVYLAVPEYHIHGQNISQKDGPALRFVPEDVPFTDEYDGEEENIQVVRPNFRVVFGQQPPAGMNAIRIAHLRAVTGAAETDPAFIPPCLNVGVSEQLMQRSLPKVLTALKLVNGKLAGARSEQDDYIASFEQSDVQRLWVLDIVNRALPELNHLLEICGPKKKALDRTEGAESDQISEDQAGTEALRRAKGGVHPEELYRFLLRLAGGLCTFSTKVKPLDFPNYDHDNLGFCFKEVTDKIEEMLKSIVYPPAKFEVIPLLDVGDGEWHGVVDNAYIRKENRFYLALRVEAKKFDVVRFVEIEKKVRLSGLNLYKELWKRAMEGAELEYEERQPRGLPGREGSKYFKIKDGSLEWNDVEETKEVHVSIRPGENDPEIEKYGVDMFVVFPAKAQ